MPPVDIPCLWFPEHEKTQALSRKHMLQLLVSCRAPLADSFYLFQAHQDVECLGNSRASRVRYACNFSRRRLMYLLYILPHSKLFRRETFLDISLNSRTRNRLRNNPRDFSVRYVDAGKSQ